MDDDRDARAVPRRRMLKALALAPATLAGCAAVGAAEPGPAAAPRARPAAAPGAPAHDAILRALRSFPVPADAEPAFVFRAGGVRPGERR